MFEQAPNQSNAVKPAGQNEGSPYEDGGKGDDTPEGRELAQKVPPLRDSPDIIKGALNGVEQGDGGNGEK